MVNLKIGGIIAGGAFVLSFLIGLISGGRMGLILLRAGILAISFFAFVVLAGILLSKFLPELLNPDEHDDGPSVGEPPVGGNIDVSVEDDKIEEKQTDKAQGFQEATFPAVNSRESFAKGLDRKQEKAYNNGGVHQEETEEEPSMPIASSPPRAAGSNKQNIDIDINDPKKIATAIQTMLKQG
jgi:hypothetical protein